MFAILWQILHQSRVRRSAIPLTKKRTFHLASPLIIKSEKRFKLEDADPYLAAIWREIKEIEAEQREIRDGYRKIRDGCREIKERCREIKDGCRGIKEGCRGIKDGCREIKDGCRQIKAEQREISAEFREMRAKLEELKDEQVIRDLKNREFDARLEKLKNRMAMMDLYDSNSTNLFICAISLIKYIEEKILLVGCSSSDQEEPSSNKASEGMSWRFLEREE
jgi:septal ring factor EnvC (AmiA/AmiB activator)